MELIVHGRLAICSITKSLLFGLFFVASAFLTFHIVSHNTLIILSTVTALSILYLFKFNVTAYNIEPYDFIRDPPESNYITYKPPPPSNNKLTLKVFFRFTCCPMIWGLTAGTSGFVFSDSPEDYGEAAFVTPYLIVSLPIVVTLLQALPKTINDQASAKGP